MSIENKIQSLSYIGKFNHKKLLGVVQDVKLIDAKLYGGIFGMATYKEVYLDIEKMKQSVNFNVLDRRMVLFIILHEIAHFKRIYKIGIDEYISNLTNENLDVYLDYILTEEIFADRWASFIYYNISGKTFPRGLTQELYLKENRVRYESRITPDHKFLVGKTKDDYLSVIKNYIIEIRK